MLLQAFLEIDSEFLITMLLQAFLEIDSEFLILKR